MQDDETYWEEYYSEEGRLYYYHKDSGNWQWGDSSCTSSPTGVADFSYWYCEKCQTSNTGEECTICSQEDDFYDTKSQLNLRFCDIVYFQDGSTGNCCFEEKNTRSRCKRLRKKDKASLYCDRPDLQPQRYSDKTEPKAQDVVKRCDSKALVEFFRTAHSNVHIHDIMKLLDQGLPIDHMDMYTGDTLLLVACRRGLLHLVQTCLNRQALNDPHPSFGQTAVQAAMDNSQYECLQALLTHFDNPMTLVNQENADGSFPIHIASEKGDSTILALLLRQNADVNLLDPRLRLAGHWAAIGNHLICLQMLFEYEADTQLESGDLYGNTMLHLAARYGNYECVQFLLESAANPQAKNGVDATPIDLAIFDGHTECTALLLEYAEDFVPLSAAVVAPPAAPIEVVNPPTKKSNKKVSSSEYEEAIDELVLLLQSSKELKDLIMLQETVSRS